MQEIYECTEKEKTKEERAKKIKILKEYIYLADNIKEIEEEYRKINAFLYSVKNQTYKEGSGSNNKENCLLERLLDKKESMLMLHKKQLMEKYEIEEKIQKAVYELVSEKERSVIVKKYFKNYKFYEIAEEMCYSEKQIVRIHNKAIDKLKI